MIDFNAAYLHFLKDKYICIFALNAHVYIHVHVHVYLLTNYSYMYVLTIVGPKGTSEK